MKDNLSRAQAPGRYVKHCARAPCDTDGEADHRPAPHEALADSRVRLYGGRVRRRGGAEPGEEKDRKEKRRTAQPRYPASVAPPGLGDVGTGGPRVAR